MIVFRRILKSITIALCIIVLSSSGSSSKNDFINEWIVIGYENIAQPNIRPNYLWLKEKGVFSRYRFNGDNKCQVYSDYYKNPKICKWKLKGNKLTLNYLNPKYRIEYSYKFVGANRMKWTNVNVDEGIESYLLIKKNSLAYDTSVLSVTEDLPAFISGKDSLSNFLLHGLSLKSRQLLDNGAVIVKLVIAKNGLVTIDSIRSDKDTLNLPYELKNEIVQLISKTSGQWKPGKIANVEVRSSFEIVLSLNSISMATTEEGFQRIPCTNQLKSKDQNNSIYSDVDSNAYFIGGADALYKSVIENFKMPKEAQELGISGLVFIQFVVERDGTLSQVKAIAPKERRLGYGLEKECIRVIKLTSGNWVPAKRNGKNVRSYWRFPFEIDNSSQLPSKQNKDK